MRQDHKDIHLSSRELIDRLGKTALQYTHERVNQIKKQGDARELDQAYLLLSEVEYLLNEEN